MKKLTTKELKDLWVKFFVSKNHKQIASSSVVPSGDGSVLFTTAGMHPIVPYLLGEPHPEGKRLCDYQKCVRTNDIESVGDSSHLTFFEMLGCWSLGDYFKEDAIKNSYEFLTSTDYLGIPVEKLAVTVFEGDQKIPYDKTAYDCWQSLGMPKDHIFTLPKENNWWALGEVGPCGPDSEMFYITDKEPCGPNCSPACDCGRYLEIWNDVFMQYVRRTEGAPLEELNQKNIDTGMGLERTVCVLNGYKSVYETDCFQSAIAILEHLSGKKYTDNANTTKGMRIIADHMRATTMIMGDMVPTTPSNVGRGYVLRRLIRRSINWARKLDIDAYDLVKLVDNYVDYFKDYYVELVTNKQFIVDELNKEIKKFSNTLTQGLREFDKVVNKLGDNKVIDGDTAFRLYDTFGFPIDVTIELANDKGIKVDKSEFEQCYKKHQELSRAQNTQVFKGGLAGTDYGYAKYHTATHILLGILRKMYGNTVEQRGSNITLERMRFDFSIDHKLESNELAEIEKQVNDVISQNLPVIREEMSKDDARKSGAVGIFNDKYGDIVTVYTIPGVDKEFCGGPHAKSTGELGHFKIVKEESCSAGIRRIKAILE